MPWVAAFGLLLVGSACLVKPYPEAPLVRHDVGGVVFFVAGELDREAAEHDLAHARAGLVALGRDPERIVSMCAAIFVHEGVRFRAPNGRSVYGVTYPDGEVFLGGGGGALLHEMLHLVEMDELGASTFHDGWRENGFAEASEAYVNVSRWLVR